MYFCKAPSTWFDKNFVLWYASIFGATVCFSTICRRFDVLDFIPTSFRVYHGKPTGIGNPYEFPGHELSGFCIADGASFLMAFLPDVTEQG